jgi:L-lactate dehydrogenase (cytochrome)
VRDQSIELFGQRFASPLVLAPTGLAGLLYRQGELLGVRAAQKLNVGYCLSSMATCSIEQIAAQGSAPNWFQLYVLRDRGLTKAFIDRAREAGCSALVVTVDTKMQGPRERDIRNGFTVPPRFRLATLLDLARHWHWMNNVMLGPKIKFRNFSGPKADTAMSITRFIADQFDLTLGWRDLEWFKAEWRGPVLVKGILSPVDARLAVEHGIDGVIVSNHGGRQLDGSVSAISALPAVVEAVQGKVPVLLDGGIRRGADVVKAIALGATACMIGRAWLYGLASGGQAGVERAITILQEEIDLALALLGCARLTDLDGSALARPVTA